MDPYRYLVLNQNLVLVLGVLQVFWSGLCVVCGFLDAGFRKDTTLSSTRTPIWGGLLMASPGVLAMFASQKKNSLLVGVMVAAAGLSCLASLVVSGYSCLTLTYGEDNEDVFHRHDSPQVTFVLQRMVKGSNAVILLSCSFSFLLAALTVCVGARSLPACYHARTGLEMLVPQSDGGDTEMVCTWTGGDDRLFNSPVHATDPDTNEEEETPSRQPPYSRLT